MRGTNRILAAFSASLGFILSCGQVFSAQIETPLVNGTFEQRSGNNAPAGFTLAGNAVYQYLGDPKLDASSRGIALQSYAGGSHPAQGSVSQTVHLAPGSGRSWRFSIRGLPQDEFSISRDGKLCLRIQFFDANGSSMDAKTMDLYGIIEQARHDLAINGDNHVSGATVWRTYAMDFVLPFPQITQVKVSVELEGGSSKRQRASDFWVDDFVLEPIPDIAMATTQPANARDPSADNLLPLGGRWFYAAKSGETKPPAQFDHTNADRLLYFDGRYETPFAGNMSAWLHAGNIDLAGHTVTAESLIADNVTVRFDSSNLIIHTHGLPNHPTGKFPQEGRGNPNSIAEQDYTFYLPLNPQANANHFVTDMTNTNRALNMGPIGVAANGVVFFNPFDADSQDATNFMDACCGHPNFDGLYHYHKYPICVNTPWTDAGDEHSPLLGWAFDGYPIYGPYEAKDQMAKDLTGENKLNGFNMHYDAERGWHYHVTPGKFPYIIGGYWGTVDNRDIGRPHHIAGVDVRGFRGGPGMGPPQRQGFRNGPPNGPPPQGPSPGF